MRDFLVVGEYQLRNLLSQRVPFLYLDLRADTAAQHLLLEGSRSVGPLNGAELVELLNKENAAKDTAIVLICENDAKSMAAAQTLTENSFINVFVIEGGVGALSSV